MMSERNNEPLSFFELIEQLGKEQIIRIPDYQREYSYGRKSAEHTMTRFADDLYKALNDDTLEASIELNPIYGDIADSCFIPVDGQQRLTTLYVLHWYLLKRAKSSEIEKLEKFKYQTRTTVKDFCEQIIKWEMNTKSGNIRTISKQLRNQHWFTEGMDSDPTVTSMLTVMDYFHTLMKTESDTNIKAFVDKLLRKSSCPILLFKHNIDLVPDEGTVKEKEQAVLDLYVKMNSRGAELTGFEIIKAGFERQCEKHEFDVIREYLHSLAKKDTPEERARLTGKINTEYTNFFFKFIDRLDKNGNCKEVDLAELRHDAAMERFLVEIFEFVFFCRMKKEGVDDKSYRGDNAYLRNLKGREFLSFIQFPVNLDDEKGPLIERLIKYANPDRTAVAEAEQKKIGEKYYAKAMADLQAWRKTDDGKDAKKRAIENQLTLFRNEYSEDEGKEKYDARLNKLFESAKSAFLDAINMYFAVQEELTKLQDEFSDGYLFGKDNDESRYKEIALIRELSEDEEKDRPIRNAVARIALYSFITRFLKGHESDDDIKKAYKTWAGMCSSIFKSANISDFEGWIAILMDLESILDDLDKSKGVGVTSEQVLTAIKEFVENDCNRIKDNPEFKKNIAIVKKAGAGDGSIEKDRAELLKAGKKATTEADKKKINSALDALKFIDKEIQSTKRKDPIIEEAVKAVLRLKKPDGEAWYEAMCDLQNKLDGQIWLALEMAKKEDASGTDSFIGNHNYLNIGSSVFPEMDLERFREAAKLFKILFDKDGVKAQWFISLEKAILCKECSVTGKGWNSRNHFYRIKGRDDFRKIPDAGSWKTALVFENGLRDERAAFYHFMNKMLDDMRGTDIDDSSVANLLETYGKGTCEGWRKIFVDHPVLFETDRGIEDTVKKNTFKGVTIGEKDLAGRYTAVYETEGRKRKNAELHSFALAMEISAELDKLKKTGSIRYNVMKEATYLDEHLMPNRYIEVSTANGEVYKVGYKMGSKKDGSSDGFWKQTGSKPIVFIGSFDDAKNMILRDL